MAPILEGQWSVLYTDGTMLRQYDRTSEQYLDDAQEVPFKAIEWDRVELVIFDGPGTHQEFEIYPNPAWALSLRSRVYMTAANTGVRVFILLVTDPVVDLFGPDIAALAAGTQSAVYWLPTGAVHTCTKFDCPDVATWALQAMLGQRTSLPSEHTNQVDTEALVAT